MTPGVSQAMESAIAIVGMACRFPGARNPDEFWQNLRAGVESIVDFTDEELLEAGVSLELLRDPAYVKRGAPLDGMELWDHEFFRFAPREAAIMDPQHRHFLEVSWEALEGAGYAPGSFTGRTGVFAGCGANSYFMFNLLTNPELVEEEGLFLLRHTGNDKDFLATRVSYHFDLKGPAVNVQTACSTSLAAVHLACQSLLSHECDMALAGSATVRQPHRHGYLPREGEILSPDGRCRAFDAEANGTVIGDGVGAVVLRRLDDAVADGDTVWGVIRGSAMNNDGSSKAGYLAPGEDGQARVVAEALAVADVEPASIGYVEGHSAGTPIGDSIEVSALTRAFRSGTDGVGFCGLGSVKSNVGHLDTASGVAGLIKTAMALRHGEIPPSLHFHEPGPATELEESPFYVVTEPTPWPAGVTPRRAGVSSLGVGGTNVHVVLEEAPRSAPTSSERPAHLILLSARSPGALERSTDRLAKHLESLPTDDLADAAYTLQCGRRAFKERRFAVCRTAEEAATVLAARDPSATRAHSADVEARSIVFLVPDVASSFDRSAPAELYREEPIFRDRVDGILGRLEPDVRRRVRTFFRDAGGTCASNGTAHQGSGVALAGFVVQCALAEMWTAWGLTPDAVIGRGIGTETADLLNGKTSLDGALRRVADRTEACAPDAPTDQDLRDALRDPRRVLLDLGPDPALARLARAHPEREPGQTILTSLPRPGESTPALDFVLGVLGRLWLSGVSIDWKALHRAERRRLPLPTYPFEPVPHYIRPGAGREAPMRAPPEGGVANGRGSNRLAERFCGGAPRIPARDLDRIRIALEAEEDIREAAVTLHDDGPGESRPVAYVVPVPGRFITVSELRRSLRARLPDELVPGRVAQLEELPRRPDGDVDLARLHDPFAPVDDYVPPTSPTERTVAEIWTRLLGAERVSLHDNFLDAGGHSLLAARALVGIEEHTSVRLPPAMLNLHTLEQISSHIDERKAHPSEGVEAPADGGVSRKLLALVRRLGRSGLNV